MFFGYLSAISPYIGGIIVWGLIGALWGYIEVLWVNIGRMENQMERTWKMNWKLGLYGG